MNSESVYNGHYISQFQHSSRG